MERPPLQPAGSEAGSGRSQSSGRRGASAHSPIQASGSLSFNYEVNIEIVDHDLAAVMERIFEFDSENCWRLQPAGSEAGSGRSQSSGRRGASAHSPIQASG
jgi:hypothetical protein